jgi:protein TonB
MTPEPGSRVARRLEVSFMTRFCTLKTSHEKYLFIAFLIAILIHAVAFALWPEYAPKPYRLREVKIPMLLDLQLPDIEIKPPPPPVKPPDIPLVIEASDDPEAAETIDPTIFEPGDPLPPPPEEPGGTRVFMYFEMPPQLVRPAMPEYPELARKAGVEGIVAVHVTVDATGRVIDAWIADSEAEILNKPAIKAAYEYVFEPALQNDIPVKATISLRFRFSLTE